VYSVHTGGANCLFADGSVRFLGESLNYPLLAAMITRGRRRGGGRRVLKRRAGPIPNRQHHT
jgi:prepilin-type processing-associated H-X9-DG protein